MQNNNNNNNNKNNNNSAQIVKAKKNHVWLKLVESRI